MENEIYSFHLAKLRNELGLCTCIWTYIKCGDDILLYFTVIHVVGVINYSLIIFFSKYFGVTSRIKIKEHSSSWHHHVVNLEIDVTDWLLLMVDRFTLSNSDYWLHTSVIDCLYRREWNYVIKISLSWKVM